jgi:hypothetical protein
VSYQIILSITLNRFTELALELAVGMDLFMSFQRSFGKETFRLANCALEIFFVVTASRTGFMELEGC